ncbi:glycoside hydrolase family 76 protein [Moniliophthora roreri MCA 2997]|uniref:Glycoside hydrolase family 76 protein n=1 Tax=Moniliophthora roreri (strain MCA 2997) TaxID=1381753 RepID=V2WLL4_MONRO|nr:glycoside hydrolase family 76 protein [Moniliophthora roreri MCA 2997]
MPCHCKLLFWSLVAPSVFAQSFSPSLWREPYLKNTPEERIQIAAAALDKAVSMLNPRGQFDGTMGGNYGFTGIMLSQMAMFDRTTNQTKYRDKLKELFPKAQEVNKGFLDLFLTIPCGAYAYAGAQAYVAYKDDTFLRFAETAWASGRAYTLSDADVTAGKIATKNFEINTECLGGSSLAGGTFWRVSEDSPMLLGLATGSFLATSALLAEATGNQTYLDAATQSADFFRAHLYDKNNIIMDYISAGRNDSCPITKGSDDSWNTGHLIEGLAILASITKRPDTEQLLRRTIYAAVNNPNRQGPSGVIKFQYADTTLIRGLSALYDRDPTPSDLRTYIQQYLSVQYNAVLELNTEPGSNNYGSSYKGPSPEQFTADGQIRSMSVLLGAISLRNDTTPSNNSDTTPSPEIPPNSDPPRSTINVVVIGGGAVGSVIFIALIGLALFFLHRRRGLRHRRYSMQAGIPPANDTVEGSNSRPADNDNRTRRDGETTGGIVGLAFRALALLFRRGKWRQSSSKMQARNVEPFPLNQEKGHLGVRRKGHQDQSDAVRPSTSVTGASSQTNPSPPSQFLGEEPGNMLPTAELIRLLNERLQGGQWREDEVPPDYASHRG